MRNTLVYIWKKYKLPFGIYALSRLVVILAIWGAVAFNITHTSNPTPLTGVSLNRWDTINYVHIAENGYISNGEFKGDGARIAFFPFFPLLISGLHDLLDIEYISAGLVIANICALLAILLFYKILLGHVPQHTALIAIALVSFHPFSFFLSMAYTESAFLLLLLLVIYALEKKNIFVASIAIPIAVVTRITGIVTALTYTYLVWTREKKVLQTIKHIAIPAVLAICAFGLFLLFQYREFGTAFAFLKAQSVNWGNTAIDPIRGFFTVVNRAFQTPDQGYESFSVMFKVDLFILIAYIVTMVIAWYRKLSPYHIYWFGLTTILFVLSSSRIQGMGRYLLLVLPAYIVWAIWLSAPKRSLALICTIALFSAWLLFNTILFTTGNIIF